MNQSKYVVLMDDRVVFQSDTLSSAAAFRDGLGSGDVAEVLSRAQEKPRRKRGSRKSQVTGKPEKT